MRRMTARFEDVVNSFETGEPFTVEVVSEEKSMPAKSRKQQQALYAKFGSKWVHDHHFDKIAGKPKKQTGKKKR